MHSLQFILYAAEQFTMQMYTVVQCIQYTSVHTVHCSALYTTVHCTLQCTGHCNALYNTFIGVQHCGERVSRALFRPAPVLIFGVHAGLHSPNYYRK